MKKAVRAVLAVMALGIGSGLLAQLAPDVIAKYDQWEAFFKTAKVTSQKQLTGDQAVTSPWILMLEENGVRHQALWKDIFGERIKGFKETWKGEIAAYRLSRALGLNMVPPTVEREFQGNRGSCQMWIESWNTLETILKKKITPPGIKAMYFTRELCLQRAFDNLIYNVDRHQRNYLIEEDWRIKGTNALTGKERAFARGRHGPSLALQSPP